LWEAEALLERLNYVRGLDGRWRERPTADEAREMQQIAALAPDGDEWWVR
jgi:hypothetical protein